MGLQLFFTDYNYVAKISPKQTQIDLDESIDHSTVMTNDAN